MANPNLIHPIPVMIALLDRDEQIYDDDTREPMHGARSTQTVRVIAQIKWGSFGEEPHEAGARQRLNGYILCRKSDLRAIGVSPKQGDRIVQIGEGLNADTNLDLYITSNDLMAHWQDQGGSTLVRFNFEDRLPVRQAPEA